MKIINVRFKILTCKTRFQRVVWKTDNILYCSSQIEHFPLQSNCYRQINGSKYIFRSRFGTVCKSSRELIQLIRTFEYSERSISKICWNAYNLRVLFWQKVADPGSKAGYQRDKLWCWEIRLSNFMGTIRIDQKVLYSERVENCTHLDRWWAAATLSSQASHKFWISDTHISLVYSTREENRESGSQTKIRNPDFPTLM